MQLVSVALKGPLMTCFDFRLRDNFFFFSTSTINCVRPLQMSPNPSVTGPFVPTHNQPARKGKKLPLERNKFQSISQAKETHRQTLDRTGTARLPPGTDLPLPPLLCPARRISSAHPAALQTHRRRRLSQSVVVLGSMNGRVWFLQNRTHPLMIN